MKKLVKNFILMSPILVSPLFFSSCADDPADDIQPIVADATEVTLTEDEEAEDR